MSLSKPAIALLEYLTAQGGGEISEGEIRQTVQISHGSFISARKELIERKFIAYEKRGGNKPPAYSVLFAEDKLEDEVFPEELLPKVYAEMDRILDMRKQSSQSTKQPSTVKTASLIENVEVMQRVVGEFSSVDDWISALMDALGECLDVECYEQSPEGDCYKVFAHEYCQEAKYKITIEDGSICVA